MSLKNNALFFRIEEDLSIGLKAASKISRTPVSGIVRDAINRRLRELVKDFPELKDPSLVLDLAPKEKMPLFQNEKIAA